MSTNRAFRVLVLHLDENKSQVRHFSDKTRWLGGSGLAAALYQEYGLPEVSWSHPDQPLIFAIGCLTGYFPLMSKVVCGFKSPYHDQYAESHAGGRLALAMRFADYDAIVIRGRAEHPVAVQVANRAIEFENVNFLWGTNVFTAGRVLRRTFPGGSGHRSNIRIGPAGETLSSYACINVDTFRHFGRLGSGSVMGIKNLKALNVVGDGNLDLPSDARGYTKLFKRVYEKMTSTDMMSKYHDLGTPQNLIPLNELKSLPWENLQKTHDERVSGISGEKFAEELLMRNTACAGCPVGCIHVGMLREMFQEGYRFQLRQVGYDYEPIFAVGSMLGVTDASDVLAIMDEVEKQGVDVMSAGVALAWATEAFQKGLVSEEQTEVPLAFGDAENYKEAIWLLGHAKGEFYERLAKGAMVAAQHYGGEDFACVLGQEMAGYATGEVFFAAQSMSFRHSHLDVGAYGFDQKNQEQDVDKAVNFLVDDEADRCILTSLVSCLFARGVYKPDLLAECFTAMDLPELAESMGEAGRNIQRLRWKTRADTGYDPSQTKVPKRFLEVETWKGKQDPEYLEALRQSYGREINRLAKEGADVWQRLEKSEKE
ncbi:aldehyde ferredoxin oxidoreductase N-terminal domain-containing protein [Desulfohalovibrio reitneri]|uniref:aldehyde ferredoxin oxidoreductase N-terminal domain-containing protein n=1 Tax=Desulfohalovibrio reitneri TaxID=1307759 RepID=UPI00054FEBE0|nr:aldehyde ferredoxin oxidoreductase C-terminal domain-containing protein [Desulfohalovibrio reitneri]